MTLTTHGSLEHQNSIRNKTIKYYGPPGTGKTNTLVQEILTKIPAEKILWEAPQKAQQLYFLELIGCNVNLGNIAPTEVIPLEAMRIGLRGDTFDLYLNK